MYRDIPVFALIPARGGSKEVPQKNLRKINNKPLIHYTIEAARKCNLIDTTYVSSDDKKIREYAILSGVKAIKRPKRISSDTSLSSAVVEHFIRKLDKSIFEKNPFIVFLQPTSPLRNKNHIIDAFKYLKKNNSESLISVAKLEFSPFKSFMINKKNKLISLFVEKKTNFRRQDLPPTYRSNGAIFIFRVSNFLKKNNFPSNGSLPFIMNEFESLDIDSEKDLNKLKKIMKL